HGRDFIDAIGKQKAAVEHRHFCVCQWHERTVDVSDLIQAASPCRRGRNRGASSLYANLSVRQDFGKEFLRAVAARAAEKVLLQGIFDNLAPVHEDDAVRDLSG